MKRFINRLLFICCAVLILCGTLKAGKPASPGSFSLREKEVDLQNVSNYLLEQVNNLDLSGFNEEQKALILTETTNYSHSLNELYKTDKEEYKNKVNEMLLKLAHGFKVYNITSRNKALEDSLNAFFGKTDLRVYVTSYIKGAFLNNLFQKLAELKYKLKENRSIQISFKFHKLNENDELDLYDYEGEVILNAVVKEMLSKALKEKTDAEETLKTLEASVNGKGIAIFQTTSDLEISIKVDEVLKRFENMDLQADPILGPIDCSNFCKRNPAERCAFLFMKLINQEGHATYMTPRLGENIYVLKGVIKVGDITVEIEKEFVNDPKYYGEYAEFLEAWGIRGLYTGLIAYPKSGAFDLLKENTCFNACTNEIFKETPESVKILAQAITAPYAAPPKILFGKDIIFEEKVNLLDRSLSFLDVPGVGTVTKTVAIKLGIKAILVRGIVKTLLTADVLNDLINRSGASDAAIAAAKNAIKTVPDTRKVFIFKAVCDKLVRVEDIPDFTKVLNNTKSDKWDDIFEAWKKTGKGADDVFKFWGDYAKKVINGEEFAIVGNKYYSREAIDAVAPSGLGKGGGGVVGQGVPKKVVDDALENGEIAVSSSKTYHSTLDVVVVTEGNGSIVRSVSKTTKRTVADGKLGLRNAFIATNAEIEAATARIRQVRNSGGSAGNYGYINGHVSKSGVKIENKVWASGPANVLTEPHIFDAIEVAGKDGVKFLRNTDSEYKMLNDLANKLGGVKNKIDPSITGEIKIVSELPFCQSCRGVLVQFNEMFPNIKLIIVNGAQ